MGVCFVYMLYILCHIHTFNTLRIMALVPDSICRCRHWGLEMPIPWSQSQSKELVVPGFELSSIWLWYQLCQMHLSHYFQVTTYGWEACWEYQCLQHWRWGQRQRQHHKKHHSASPGLHMLLPWIWDTPILHLPQPYLLCRTDSVTPLPGSLHKHCKIRLALPSFMTPHFNTSHPTF